MAGIPALDAQPLTAPCIAFTSFSALYAWGTSASPPHPPALRRALAVQDVVSTRCTPRAAMQACDGPGHGARVVHGTELVLRLLLARKY